MKCHVDARGRIVGHKKILKVAQENWIKSSNKILELINPYFPKYKSINIWPVEKFKILYNQVNGDKENFIEQCCVHIEGLEIKDATKHLIDMYERIFNAIEIKLIPIKKGQKLKFFND